MWQKIKNIYHFAQALFAAIFFNFPSKKLTVIGVTGTDGKTTTVNMIYHILKFAGRKVSMISSVNAQIGDKTYDTGLHVSTPSPWKVQNYLSQAAKSGSEYFVLEATSHGLDQNRLTFVDFKVAVLTNITHEHLDYHGTFENYRKAKLKLFKNVQVSVINADDSSYDYVKKHASGRIISYSTGGKGDFNFSNIQAAIRATTALGIAKNTAQIAFKTFPGVRGRIEEIKLEQPYRVIIDFAHTPNGLEQALISLRSQLKAKSSRLIVVFGAAGERDTRKRPMMGKIVSHLADLVILTSEDPRRENPQEIALQIASGMNGKKAHIILDRKEAIEFAVNLANKNDIVAIFGKGHEKSMTFGNKETPWDEFEVTKQAISKRILKNPEENYD